MLDQLKKPRALRAGDTVAAVTLSWGGPGAIPNRYAIGKRQLEETLGLTVIDMPHTCADPAFIQAHPEARARDLHDAFADANIMGIVSSIGGDDSIRLLPFLDLDLMAQNPKVFIGYSDTTIAHLACMQAGLSSFYGPSMMSGFAENGGMHDYLVDALRRTVFEAQAPGLIPENHAGWTVELLDWQSDENNATRRALTPASGWRYLQGQGVTQGRLIGGCLEVLDIVRGTPLWPSEDAWQGAILFLETSEEAPSPDLVVRMLRSLAATGALNEIAGILLGRPGGQIAPKDFDAYDDALLQVVTQEQKLSHLPIVTRMDFGHTDPMLTLPYGGLAEIDCEQKQLRLLEACVT